MKYAIPLGTILLVAATAALHRSAPPAAEGKPGATPRPEVRDEAPAERRAPAEPPVRAEVPVPTIAPSRGAAPARPASSTSWRKLMVQADRAMELSLVQRSAVEQMLKERDEEIRALHESILRSGVIDIRRYDLQTDALKDGWFRKIDALLDRVQHEKFLELVQRGFLGEGLAFTVEPGMTVLD